MICYVVAIGKQHLVPHVVVGYGIKIFCSGLFITLPDHLARCLWTEAVSHIRKKCRGFKIIRIRVNGALQNKQNQKSLSSDEWDLRISILICVL